MKSNDRKKLLAAAIAKRDALKRNLCFDPFKLESRPTLKQRGPLEDRTSLLIYCVAGNQCIAKGTEIITTTGIKFIENIKVGDFVYDENGNPIEVLNTFNNGLKEVNDLTHRNMVMVSATSSHVFLTNNSSSRNKKETEREVKDFGRDTQIKRVEINSSLGEIDNPHAYSIGVFLGDGCSRESGKVISGNDPEVIYKVAKELNCSKIGEPKWGNYSWRLFGSPECNHYNEWCRNKYAHEKIIDLEVVKSWNRTSLLNYVAGVLDTDGSIYVDSWNNLTIRCEMQAKSVIESLKYAFIALWQTPVTLMKCDREKYVNGPCWAVKTANNIYTKRMIKELDNYLQCPRKRWKVEYSDLTSERSNAEWIGVKVKEDSYVAETYDIHVASNQNLYCLANGLVTHNSGKSTIGARRTSWMFLESDPHWKRPNSRSCNMCESTDFHRILVPNEAGEMEESEIYECHNCPHKWVDWADEPLLLIVAGRTTDQLDKLWKTKIEPFLPKDSYNKPKKQGGVLKEVVNKHNGNTIIFTSHDKAKEAAEKVQSYVANFVWLDEMPGDYKYIEELQRRCDSKRAQFIATFTPKSRNEKIKSMVDNVDSSVGIKYQMGMLDNPRFWGREEEQRAKIAHLPLEQQLAILEGAWMGVEERVFNLEREFHIDPIPKSYSVNWPHIVSTDPAASGKAGLVIAARNPEDEKWWVIKAMYLAGKAPSDLVEEIEKIAEPYNVVRRVYDPHETGFLKEANKAGIRGYMGVWNKSQRKKELITNVQQALKDGWLKFSERLYDMYSELNDAEWNLDETGIRRSTKYHLLDALQYMIDNLPSKPKEVEVLSYDAALIKASKQQATSPERWKGAFRSKRKRYHRVRGKQIRRNVGL